MSSSAVQNADQNLSADPPRVSSPIENQSFRIVGLTTIVIAVVLVLISSQLRNEVELFEIIRFVAYISIGVLLPGLICSRVLIGVRATWPEDLAVGFATGLAAQLVVWVFTMLVGLGWISVFWGLPVLVAAAVRPDIRPKLVARPPKSLGLAQSAALAVTALTVAIRTDVFSLRTAPLPPNGGQLYLDMWWHLSIIGDIQRWGRPSVPQVSGELLDYHVYAHAHTAITSFGSGIDPEVVMLRLWPMTIMMAGVGLAVAVGREVSGSGWAGIAASWFTFGSSPTRYFWPDLPVVGGNPLVFSSPTQILANVSVLACALGVVLVLRGQTDRKTMLWTGVAILGAAAAKSTMLPLLLAGFLVVSVVAAVQKSPLRKHIFAMTGAVLVLQLLVVSLASGNSGGKVTLFGSLASFPTYRDLVGPLGLRAANEGLILDSMNDGRSLLTAAGVLLFFAVTQAIRLIGALTVWRSETRADLARWWLAGAVAAGVAVFLAIDHVGFGQIYFFHTAIPLGAVLTLAALVSALDRVAPLVPNPGAFTRELAASALAARRKLIAVGAGLGLVLALSLEFFTAQRRLVSSYEALEKLLFPLGIGLAFCLCAAAFVKTQKIESATWIPVALVAVMMLSVPYDVSAGVRNVWRLPNSTEPVVNVDAVDHVTALEIEGLDWLRDNSDRDSVVATNVHCRPVTDPVNGCDSRAFWVSGMTGRRTVLESWGYTDEALAAHGVNGASFARQPTPFEDRLLLTQAAIRNGDAEAIDCLQSNYGATHLVVVNRAGPRSDQLATLTTLSYENGDVEIYELPAPTGTACTWEQATSVGVAAEIVAALEAFGAANGTYAVPGGHLNTGQGPWLLEGPDGYEISIANALVDGGYLASVPQDPAYLIDPTADQVIYTCENRVAVFSKSDEPADETDLAWWTENDCTFYPMETLGRPHLTLSDPLS